MSLILKKAFRKLPFCHGKTTNEGLKLTQSSRVNPTPADAIKALELELTEERTKFVRLEQEYQRAKDELKTLSGAKRELDTEILEVRELLEARGKDLDKTQAKVCRAVMGISSRKLTFYPPEGERVTGSSCTRSGVVRTVIRNGEATS